MNDLSIKEGKNKGEKGGKKKKWRKYIKKKSKVYI